MEAIVGRRAAIVVSGWLRGVAQFAVRPCVRTRARQRVRPIGLDGLGLSGSCERGRQSSKNGCPGQPAPLIQRRKLALPGSTLQRASQTKKGRWGMRCLVAFGVAMIVVCATASAAVASGGANIASAPTVVYGQQEFGNTVTDDGQGTPNCDTTRGPGRSWWTLPVTAGDRVTIDLGGQTQGDGFSIDVYATGTNDFDVAQRLPYASEDDFRDQVELVFTAPVSGTMPMDVSTCDDIGTYAFTAYVQHRLVLSLSAGATNHRSHRTKLIVGAHNPDGVVVNSAVLRCRFERLGHRKWIMIATRAQPFALSYKWPRSERGTWQWLRVQVSGSGYLTAASQSVRVRAA